MNCVTSLFEHQQAAVDKLLPSRVGALFMDMGTGKTRVAIQFAYLRQSRIDRVVWFCPVSLKQTVAYEIAKHTDSPASDLVVFDDATRSGSVPAVFWYIVGIESMSASTRAVLAANSIITERSFVIVDESSYIKGHASIRTRRITAMSERARYRMVLTGTPISQGIVDLYAQMRFLSPMILGYRSFYSFAANHLVYSEDHPGEIVKTLDVEHVAQCVGPYVYQVKKDECVTLPPKLYDERRFGMTYEQWEAYQAAKDRVLACLDEDISGTTIFRLFSDLQKIVCGFMKINGQVVRLASQRMEMLMTAIEDIPADQKVIIWSKYLVNHQDIVSELAARYGEQSVAQLHGGIVESRRAGQIAAFRSTARFLVATQSTGGHGFTLNEATYSVFFSNEFKYANRIQAEDRCHRIGQTERVTYIDLVCVGSIDERIMKALAHKQNAVREFARQVDQIKRQSGRVDGLLKAL